MKKRKLNSKNPKYLKESNEKNKPQFRRELINDKSVVKIYAVFEKHN